jgi:hypothetical protein
MIKFYCDIEGFKDNWIGISERWTQKEAKAADAAMSDGWEAYLNFLSGKVDGCNIVTETGAITSFAEVTESTLDEMDLRLVGFIGGILQQAIARLRALGNVSARVSSPTNGGKS